MNCISTKLEGCFIIEPNLIGDERGYFMESFNEDAFHRATNTNVRFVQDNQSYSTKGVLRGLHYQTGEHAQAKLVRVISGAVLDVAVDSRPGSATFGEHVTVELSAENHRQLYMPRGFAHGFLVLSENATFFYKCDNYYNKDSEGGIIYDDKSLNINWQFSAEKLIISGKDRELPTSADAKPVW